MTLRGDIRREVACMFDKKLASGEHGGIAAVCGKAKLAAKLASHSVRDSHTLTTTFVKCSNRCSFILLDLILRLSATFYIPNPINLFSQ